MHFDAGQHRDTTLRLLAVASLACFCAARFKDEARFEFSCGSRGPTLSVDQPVTSGHRWQMRNTDPLHGGMLPAVSAGNSRIVANPEVMFEETGLRRGRSRSQKTSLKEGRCARTAPLRTRLDNWRKSIKQTSMAKGRTRNQAKTKRAVRPSRTKQLSNLRKRKPIPPAAHNRCEL